MDNRETRTTVSPSGNNEDVDLQATQNQSKADQELSQILTLPQTERITTEAPTARITDVANNNNEIADVAINNNSIPENSENDQQELSDTDVVPGISNDDAANSNNDQGQADTVNLETGNFDVPLKFLLKTNNKFVECEVIGYAGKFNKILISDLNVVVWCKEDELVAHNPEILEQQRLEQEMDEDLQSNQNYGTSLYQLMQHMQQQRQQQQMEMKKNGGMSTVLSTPFQPKTNSTHYNLLLPGNTPIPVLNNPYQTIQSNEVKQTPQSRTITSVATQQSQPKAATVTNVSGLVIPNATNSEQRAKQFRKHLNKHLNQGDDDDEMSSDDDDDEPNNDENGNGNGNGSRNGNGNGSNNDNNDGNDQNNGNDALVILAQNQEDLIKMLSKKKENKINKLPTCEIKFYGIDKKGKKEDLFRIAWEVKQFCSNKGIDKKHMLKVWMSDVLQEPAKSIIYRQSDRITTFDALIEILNMYHPVRPKIFEVMKRLRNFEYQGKTSMAKHVNEYTVIISDLLKEKWVWEKVIRKGRLPDLPTTQQQYQYLFRSITNLERLYYKVQELMVQYNPSINSSDYLIQASDIDALGSRMMLAETMLYPENELIRYDLRTTKVFASAGGKRKYKPKRDHDTTGTQKYRRPNQKSKRERRNKRDGKRRMHQNQVKSKFKAKCHACQGSHPVRVCNNEQAKTKYCRENDLCLFCCRNGHKVKDCPEKKEWENKKKAGNGHGQTNQSNQKHRKWNRAAIRFSIPCKHHKETEFNDDNHSECKFGHNCHYLHKNDYSVTESESEINDSQQSTTKSERTESDDSQYGGQKRMHTMTRKERMFIKSSLETVRMDRYQLSVEEIPDNEKAKIHLKKNENEAIAYKTLIDAGSTTSAIIPKVADKMMKEVIYKEIKKSAFYVQNGSGKDVKFDGKILEIPTLVPNTKEFIPMQYYVMPHNECCFGIIIDDAGRKKLGYVLGLQIDEDKVLFRHRGKRRRNRMENVESANKIMDRLNNLPGFALQNKNISMY